MCGDILLRVRKPRNDLFQAEWAADAQKRVPTVMIFVWGIANEGDPPGRLYTIITLL
jgi:hypothetical protein